MTAHSMSGDRERCLAAGMDDYLSKPLRGEDLDAVLARWVPASDAPQADDVASDAGESDVGAGEHGGPIDLETLGRLRTELSGLGRSSDVVDSLIRQFVDTAPGQVAAIAAAVERGDCERLSQQAHGLKGSSSTFGAARLATLSSALEQAGRDGDLDQARTLSAELDEAWSATRIALEASLAALASEAPDPLRS
jgi:two-component system sensor histidine kinase/response regulator